MSKFVAGDGTPVIEPEDVRPFLGKPYQLKRGRSAWELAHSWISAERFPAPVREVLATPADFHDVVFEQGAFEKQTDIITPGGASQSDLLVLAHSADERVVILVEAKVDEGFGKLIAAWTDRTPGEEYRLEHLRCFLGIGQGDLPHLRYQLLHRTASAVLEAQRRGLRRALVLVHSFDPGNHGVGDFLAFAHAFGIEGAGRGVVASPHRIQQVDLSLGWVPDRPAA
jgi:hypothetical protein